MSSKKRYNLLLLGNIEGVLASAKTAKEGWTSLQGHIRARHLYRYTKLYLLDE